MHHQNHSANDQCSENRYPTTSRLITYGKSRTKRAHGHNAIKEDSESSDITVPSGETLGDMEGKRSRGEGYGGRVVHDADDYTVLPIKSTSGKTVYVTWPTRLSIT
jgi:hypothetical protein